MWAERLYVSVYVAIQAMSRALVCHQAGTRGGFARSMRPVFFLLILNGLCSLWPSSVSGQAPVYLTAGQDDYALGLHLAVLRDEQHQWTIQDVISPEVAKLFEVSRKDVPAFRYDEAAYWIRFSAVRSSEVPANWLLEISNKSLDDIRLYIPAGDGQYVEKRAGDDMPFGAREIKDRNFVFSLPIADTVGVFYLRAQSKAPLHFPLRILSLESYLQRSRSDQLFLGVFLGILLAMALYHLILYLSIKDPTYFYYVLFIVYLLLYEISVQRVGAEYLWPNNLWWAERSNSTLILITGILALQFARSFLRSRIFAPRMDMLLLVFMALSVPMIAWNLMGMDRTVNNATIAFFGIMHLAMISAAVVCLFRGDQATRYYLVAWSFFIVGGFLRLAGLWQLIPPSSFAALHGMQIGTALEVTLFAMGLGYRYKVMNSERERLRLRIASDLHDDIGSGLTQITLRSELLRRAADPKAAELAGQIGAQAHELAMTMRDIVWSIEPKQDSWEALEMRMKDHAIGLLGPAGITFDMQGDLLFEHKTLPIEVRQNILMLFKEVVHNAVKHAECTEFTVRWRLDRKALWMQFRDNGKGFDPQEVRNGHGLGSMRRRSRAVNGRLEIDSAPGKSTTITIEAPLQKAAFSVQSA